ncbi:MAG: MOSC domain-containing protein [Chloroflexi bacterium]|nr:MOSC domain-containing protein [Chloroflexota bacterium]
MVDSTDVAEHLDLDRLEAGLDEIRRSPADGGALLMIVRRPGIDEREVVEEASLDVAVGVVGDSWQDRPSSSSADGGPHPLAQVTIINSRMLDLVARSRERWPLAGDQLAIDLDMSAENLPPGTRLSIGSAVIEVTEKPHTGCLKFASRFGHDALRFVSTAEAMAMRLRGVNTRVVQSGTVRIGDTVAKIAAP